MAKSQFPKWLPTLLWSIILVLFPTPAIFSGTWWAFLLAALCFGMVGLLWFPILAPNKLQYDIRRFPGGFEFHAPLRRMRTIEFGSITQIDAIVARDGDMGLPFVDLIVRTKRGSVRIPESLLHQSGLLMELRALPNFNGDAYDLALAYEPSGIAEVFSKRFTVLDAA